MINKKKLKRKGVTEINIFSCCYCKQPVAKRDVLFVQHIIIIFLRVSLKQKEEETQNISQ